MIDTYVFAYISWQFSDAFAQQDLTPLFIETQKPDPKEIEKISNLILSSKKPIMLLGSQVPIKPNDPSVIADIIKVIKK